MSAPLPGGGGRNGGPPAARPLPGSHPTERAALEAAADLAEASPAEILRWALARFGDRICVTSSMSDAVVVHMASALRPGVDVVFLDTGYHFAETIGTRDAVAAVYPVNLVSVTSAMTVAEQDAELGPRLFARDPDTCCRLRKVEPLERALRRYDAWISGVRRDETARRRGTGPVEWDGRRQMVKVNPIASWTMEQVDDYIAENGILVNPLAYDGYPSIGCQPCTSRVTPGADPRSGRWAGTDKIECGIHAQDLPAGPHARPATRALRRVGLGKYSCDVDTTRHLPRVLVLGLDPHRVPGPWDPAPVAEAIETGIARFAEHDVGVQTCLIGLDGSDDIAAVVTESLRARPWECVVVGGGIRAADDQLQLFEQVINLVHRHAAAAAIAFSNAPEDTFEAAARWLKSPASDAAGRPSGS